MSKLEQLKEKAKGLEAKDPKKAVEIWLEVLNNQDETNPDLSVYNRIGDLYIKEKDPALAADYYDQAVDKYAELGFHNNAIAMCNKVLRNAPARQTTYLKLAKLYAAKGFIGEAKQNFVEYAERMQKVGKIEHAFAALKEFTDISPESASLRDMLSEHLKMYGADPGKRASSAGGRVTPPAPRTAPPPGGDDVHKSGSRKTSSLVFLDLDAPSVAKGQKAPPAPPKAPPPAPEPPPPVAEGPEDRRRHHVDENETGRQQAELRVREPQLGFLQTFEQGGDDEAVEVIEEVDEREDREPDARGPLGIQGRYAARFSGPSQTVTSATDALPRRPEDPSRSAK